MGTYIPNTPEEQQEMLKVVGVETLEDLYEVVPHEMLVDELNIPEGKSQLEVERHLEELASKNQAFTKIFRGAGAYDHYIPPMVRKVPAKESFLTSYTPYQSEVSQGVLQNIFEYQTMICELTGMDVSNASLYDGAEACAEASSMSVEKKRTKTLVAAGVHPEYLQTVQTYAHGKGHAVEVIPSTEAGTIDLDALKDMLADETVASVILQQPNFFGLIEPAKEVGAILSESKAKFIMCVNPTAMALYATPGECQADIACGEGQPLGMPLSFGGPYLGFMATTNKLVRKMPGRIVGQTVDVNGKRSYVLTLQTREQHIRREKATSNVCTNQALCALTASVYLASMGPQGLTQVAEQSRAKAYYLKGELTKIPGFELVYNGETFHEFLTTCPVPPQELEAALAQVGILSGLPVGDNMLWCATEKRTKAEMDELVARIKEIVQGR